MQMQLNDWVLETIITTLVITWESALCNPECVSRVAFTQATLIMLRTIKEKLCTTNSRVWAVISPRMNIHMQICFKDLG